MDLNVHSKARVGGVQELSACGFEHRCFSGRARRQAQDALTSVGFAPGSKPLSISVSLAPLSPGPQETLGWAFEVGLQQRGCDLHGLPPDCATRTSGTPPGYWDRLG